MKYIRRDACEITFEIFYKLTAGKVHVKGILNSVLGKLGKIKFQRLVYIFKLRLLYWRLRYMLKKI